ncbi:MAG: methionyl-tRNA formyltransferase [Elusimicrobia bacterium]|nr:methionyl-tRNA formyltransferase [Elusimicrobiota bacterium]
MRTVFFGTPKTAVPFLRLLAARTEVLAVVSQPDRPAGRGLALAPTPVKAAAVGLGLRVLQPERPADAVDELKALAPDLAVVVAYGRLLASDVLRTARLGFLNVHFSVLPQYRGAAPVQWALARGEARTGVTLFWLDEGLDTGPVQSVREAAIGLDEDAPALLERLTPLGVGLLDEALAELAAGRAVRRPQSGEASPAPLIRREDARLDLSRPARELHDRVRAFRAWPRAWLERRGGGSLRVLRAALPGPEDPPGTGRPGRVLRVERGRGILVECASRSRLWLLDVQPEGKKTLNAAEFANGLRLAEGDFLPVSGSEA